MAMSAKCIQDILSGKYKYIVFYMNDTTMSNVFLKTNNPQEVKNLILQDNEGSDDTKRCMHAVITKDNTTELELQKETKKVSDFPTYCSFKIIN